MAQHGPISDDVPGEGFPVLEDTRPDDMSLPAFMVSTTRGFLPRMDPIVRLPPEFDAVESLLQRMPVKTAGGTPGLLAHGKLGEAVLAELPDLTDAVDKYKDNLPLMNALYRDYSFLASAYLLEPCHERFVRGESYGPARDVLPKNISHPIARCAEICGFRPFMEYAGSYALYNYCLVDPSAGLEYSNLRLIRAFEHGLDPGSSEAGFVLVHIAMVTHSGGLIAGTMAALDACTAAASTDSPQAALQHRLAFNAGLAAVLAAAQQVNATMESMWARSRPASYTSFRTFIFGTAAQAELFPRGVVYEGLYGDQPVTFRGESGANDSMVPLLDNLLQLPMPDTPLTAILRDFRSYRPSNHRQFLAYVGQRAEALGLRGYALALRSSATAGEDEDGDGDGDMAAATTESCRLWLRVLDQVRDFRYRHWCFAREYILKRTAHPTATGGSPVVTWLPNQLRAVLAEMEAVYGEVCAARGERCLGADMVDIMERVGRQKSALANEVARYCRERGVKEA